MFIATTDNIEGKSLEHLGLVEGSIVNTKNVGRDIMAGFKNIVGGEIVSYTKMMNEAREVATKRIIEAAEKLGADAIVGLRYSSSAVMGGAAEIIAYGTAVKYKK